MAIQIREQLTASPNPIDLPTRVEFRQTLRSNREAEAIRVTYTLDPDHNVWFEDASNNPVKAVERTETVGKQDQVCVDRIVMQAGTGQGPMAMVEVRQTITDAAGITSNDLCLVRIQA